VEDSKPKRVVRILAALAMVSIGIAHFVNPNAFVKIVPKIAPDPWPMVAVLVSGFFEIAGGIGLLIPRVQRIAAIGLVLLYVAVFPANINMAMNDIQPDGFHVPAAAMWLRLPFQIAFIAIAWWLRRGSPPAKR
jgi:uncharacterized membrane protein